MVIHSNVTEKQVLTVKDLKGVIWEIQVLFTGR